MSTSPQPSPNALSWHAFMTTYLPSLVLALGTGIVVPVIPTLARSFHVSFAVASFVVTIFLIGNVAGTLPSGWIVDRFGRKHIMIAGPVLTALMAFMTVTAHTFAELLIYRFLDGFAAQMWLIGRLAAISHRAKPNQRGRQVTWMYGMNNSGRLAGPLVGGFIGAQWGLRAPFIAYGVLALLALLPSLVLDRDHDTPRRAPGPKVAKPSLRELVQPRLAYFAVVLFASMARGPVQADLLHLYAAFAYHLGPSQIGYLAAGAGILSVPVGFAAGSMMDRLGRKKTMVPGFIGVAIAMLALALSALLHFDLFWYVVLFLIAVCAQSLTSGSIQTLGADVAPVEGRGMFLGWWRFVGTAAAAVSPVAFAVLADKLSYGSAFVFIAATSAAAAYLLVRFIPETNRITTTSMPAVIGPAPGVT